VADNFGEFSGQAFAPAAGKILPHVCANNNTAVGANYFSTVGAQSYLWSYACGGGSFYTCGGVGSSDDFANIDIQSVFTMFFGSYFGDWTARVIFCARRSAAPVTRWCHSGPGAPIGSSIKWLSAKPSAPARA